MFDDELSPPGAGTFREALAAGDEHELSAPVEANRRRHAIGFRVALAGQSNRCARFEPSFLLLLLLLLLLLVLNLESGIDDTRVAPIAGLSGTTKSVGGL
jgi:hypothetical protein